MDSTGYFIYNSVSVEREELMGIVDQVEGAAKRWILAKGIQKGAVSLAKLVVSYAAAHGIKFVGSIGGINIDLNDVIVMTAAINSALATVRNMLKTKYPKQFGWL